MTIFSFIMVIVFVVVLGANILAIAIRSYKEDEYEGMIREGMVRKGGVNTNPITPRPDPPKAQGLPTPQTHIIKIQK